MKQKKVVYGVILSQSRNQKQEIRSALTWLDIKIGEFMEHINRKPKYAETNRAIVEFSEILGVLKFLYMAEIMTIEEFKLIVKEITGKELTDEEVNRV